MRLALAQLNPTIGDIPANAARIAEAAARAGADGADLLAVPELAICGYPPKDLLIHDGFVRACVAACDRVGASAPPALTLVIGTPLLDEHGGIRNALLVYRGGARIAAYSKRLLPTYDVFDEDRYFEPGDAPVVIDVAGVRVGLAICEDLWKGEDAGFSSHYRDVPDPVAELAAAGAQVLLVPSASPFVLGKGRRHRDILKAHAKRHGLWVAAVNQVGGNDDLVFDGHAAVYAPDATLHAAAPGFAKHVLVAEVQPITAGGVAAALGGHANAEAASASGATSPSETNEPDARASGSAPGVQDPLLTAPDERLVIDALTLGTRDYLAKTGFTSAVLGLSGGIDSAVTAAIACRAIGPANVLGLAMPSRYSSSHSVEDAHDLAARLGVRCIDIPIADSVGTCAAALDNAFDLLDQPRLGATLPDITEENLQSRIRGLIAMGVSNRTGAIVLTTGNKSELAVGYSTLYGDMNGGLAVLSDVPKTMVYRLARHMNDHAAALGFPRPPIPARTITKPPSAELRPDQTDQDSLPPYDVLDRIIEGYVERRETPHTIIERTGFDAQTVLRVVRMIDIAEYKRKQLAIGLKVTGVAFGQGRRMPIAQRWRERA